MRGKALRDPRRERAGCGNYLGYLRLPRSCAGVALLVGYQDLLYSSLSRRFSPPGNTQAGESPGEWYGMRMLLSSQVCERRTSVQQKPVRYPG